MAHTFQQIMDTEREPGQHVMAMMNSSGDLKTIWSADKPDEVAITRRAFEDAKKKGYMAYRVNRKGDKGEVLLEADEFRFRQIANITRRAV